MFLTQFPPRTREDTSTAVNTYNVLNLESSLTGMLGPRIEVSHPPNITTSPLDNVEQAVCHIRLVGTLKTHKKAIVKKLFDHTHKLPVLVKYGLLVYTCPN